MALTRMNGKKRFHEASVDLQELNLALMNSTDDLIWSVDP